MRVAWPNSRFDLQHQSTNFLPDLALILSWAVRPLEQFFPSLSVSRFLSRLSLLEICNFLSSSLFSFAPDLGTLGPLEALHFNVLERVSLRKNGPSTPPWSLHSRVPINRASEWDLAICFFFLPVDHLLKSYVTEPVLPSPEPTSEPRIRHFSIIRIAAGPISLSPFARGNFDSIVALSSYLNLYLHLNPGLTNRDI